MVAGMGEYVQLREDGGDLDPLEAIHQQKKSRRQIWVAGVVLGITVSIGLIVLIVNLVPGSADQPEQPHRNPLSGQFSKAAVAVDGEPCASVGRAVLVEGGTAVDAAVAALLCNGVYNSQSMGIGGGFLMTIFSGGEVFTLNAREMAPAWSSVSMYGSNSSLAVKGPLSVAIPGEIAGYWQARDRFGNLSLTWRRIMQPTIDMCRHGIPVSWTMAKKLSEQTFSDSTMRAVMTDPTTGQPWREGQTYTRQALADTLDELADAGHDGIIDLFYRGNIAKKLVHDLEKLGGRISLQDLNGYRAVWRPPVSVFLSSLNLTLYSVPPPGSGAVLGAILNIIDNSPDFQDNPLFYHRLVEAFKFAYGERSKLGDPQDPSITSMVNSLVANMTSAEWGRDKYRLILDNSTQEDMAVYGGKFFNKPDHGTAHLSVLAANGDAVSVTSTINQIFGSGIMSPSTGIIYNDEMDDFSFPGFSNEFNLPPSPSNFVAAGKRPLSSMSPSIFLDQNNKARLVIGAAGGSKITTATALTAALTLWLEKDLASAVAAPRLHHQLRPNTLKYQSQFDQATIESLKSRGHTVEDMGDASSVVGAILVSDKGISASADYRKAGGVDGF